MANTSASVRMCIPTSHLQGGYSQLTCTTQQKTAVQGTTQAQYPAAWVLPYMHAHTHARTQTLMHARTTYICIMMW